MIQVIKEQDRFKGKIDCLAYFSLGEYDDPSYIIQRCMAVYFVIDGKVSLNDKVQSVVQDWSNEK